MDFHDMFRKFFHINPNGYTDSFIPHDEDRSEGDDSSKFYDDFENFNPHTDIFNQMEDMLSRMFSSFGIISFPRIEEPMQPQITNPRQAMIKDTDEDFSNSSSYREELVLPFSDESKKGNIGKSYSFSYLKFSSIRTRHLPDGTIEEHRTMIDNDGNKTTTVRRTIGDTSHEVTTKSDPQGIKEKEENFMNMDENELPNFDQKWDSFKKDDAIDPGVPSIDLSESSPSYFNILKKFFGPSHKELKWV